MVGIWLVALGIGYRAASCCSLLVWNVLGGQSSGPTGDDFELFDRSVMEPWNDVVQCYFLIVRGLG
jgi:hypothetical protein